MNTQKYDILSGISNFKFLSFSLICCVLLAGCWGSSGPQSSKLVVINVLDADYYQDCHMTGSINIPFEEFEERMKTLQKQDSYVLYCSNYSCTAAPFAAQLLKQAGFEDVALFPGGIVEWYQKGYPCTGSCQKEYLKEDNEKFADEDDHGDLKIMSAESLNVAMQEKTT